MEDSLRCCNNLKPYFLQWSKSREWKREREVATWRRASQHTTWNCPADLVCCSHIATFVLLFQPNILSQKLHEHYQYPTQQETEVTSPLRLTHNRQSADSPASAPPSPTNHTDSLQPSSPRIPLSQVPIPGGIPWEHACQANRGSK